LQQFRANLVQYFQKQSTQRGAALAIIGAVMPRFVGEKLRGLREGKFLSHRELATRAGVSPTTVLNLEAGKAEPQRRTIRKLARALGVDPAELVE
jgi:DNA-binding XRE family transcriptional regulator